VHRGQVVLEPVSTAAGKQLQTLYGDAAWDVDDLDSDYDNAFRAGWRWYPVPAVKIKSHEHRCVCLTAPAASSRGHPRHTHES